MAKTQIDPKDLVATGSTSPCAIEKNFPHHGAVAFGHYGKALYEVFKYIGVPVEEIGYNQPAGVRYPTENPFA